MQDSFAGQNLKPTHERIVRYEWTPKIYGKLPFISVTIIFIIKKFIEHFCGPGGCRDSSDCQVEVADTWVGSCNFTIIITCSKYDFIAIFELDNVRDLFLSDDSEKVFPLFHL